MDDGKLRPELTELPLRLRGLPVDRRGFPVPWFVQWLNPEKQEAAPGMPGAYPEFRLMDARKYVAALKENLCWVCGFRMGIYKTFVVGPMCGVNRTTAEPPCHLDCATWSAINCPFLSRPHMVRREDALTDECRENAPGIMLDRNPGVTLLWTTKGFKVWRDPEGKPLIEMGEPTALRFLAAGREATRAEVAAAVESGLPTLMAMAEQQDRDDPGAKSVECLQEFVARFERLYPAA